MISFVQTTDYAAQRRIVAALQKQYPFLRVGVIGRSRMGKAIFRLSVGEGDKQVLFCGGFHGSEWITVWLMLRFAEELCGSLQQQAPMAEIDVPAFLRRREIVIVPCVNPDGTDIFLHGPAAAGIREAFVRSVWDAQTPWNANAAGVDINHNFDAGWHKLRAAEKKQGILSPAPRRYGGPKAESEPETQALCTLCRRIPPQHALAFHSQGEEIFWKYGRAAPPRGESLMRVFSAASGYKPVRNAGLYAHGGFKDWFIRTFDRPGFTVEVGKGVNPLPTEEFEPIYAQLREMLTLAAVL